MYLYQTAHAVADKDFGHMVSCNSLSTPARRLSTFCHILLCLVQVQKVSFVSCGDAQGFIVHTPIDFHMCRKISKNGQHTTKQPLEIYICWSFIWTMCHLGPSTEVWGQEKKKKRKYKKFPVAKSWRLNQWHWLSKLRFSFNFQFS